MNYAAKVDTNQVQIVTQLRSLGFDVDVISQLKRKYDLVVSGVPTWSKRAVAVRVEIKASDKSTLTPGEMEYWAKQRNRDNLIRANSLDDVLRWFGKIATQATEPRTRQKAK